MALRNWSYERALPRHPAAYCPVRATAPLAPAEAHGGEHETTPEPQ